LFAKASPRARVLKTTIALLVTVHPGPPSNARALSSPIHAFVTSAVIEVACAGALTLKAILVYNESRSTRWALLTYRAHHFTFNPAQPLGANAFSVHARVAIARLVV